MSTFSFSKPIIKRFVVVILSVVLGNFLFHELMVAGERSSDSQTQSTQEIFCVNLYMPTVGRNHVSEYFMGPDEIEPNNDSFQANGPLLPNATYTGYPTDEHDVFYIFLHASGTITLHVENHDVDKGQLQLSSPFMYTYPLPGAHPPHDYTLVFTNATLGSYFFQLYTDVNYPYTQTTPYTLQVDYPPTPTPVPQPARYQVEFDGKLIVSHLSESEARTNPVDVLIPSGYYKITLASSDDHISKPTPQLKEIWHLEFYNAQGKLITKSNSISDLLDEQNCFMEVVDDSLFISETVTLVYGFHGAFGDEDRNSVVPVFAWLEEVNTEPSSLSVLPQDSP